MLRPDKTGNMVGVDRQANVLRGVVICEVGDFKTQRGRFNSAGIARVASMMRMDRDGIRSRFRHPGLLQDSLGSFLGRLRNARIEATRCRADLHFDVSAFKTPEGDLANYLMDLADSDERAFAFSLNAQFEKVIETDYRGRPVRGADGLQLSPLWVVQSIAAVDAVDIGDATSSALALPRSETDDQLRARNAARKSLYGLDHEVELLRLRNRNRKRKIEMGIY